MAGQTGQIRVGISGWTYPPWRGVFYPRGLRQADELPFASRSVTSIEINGTFYGLQRPDAFAAWSAAVPEDFVFAVKAPRYLTHVLRVGEFEAAFRNFLASGVLRLGPKLGPLLWQFPPNFRFDAGRMERFLGLLPHDTEAAAALARGHDSHLRKGAWTETDALRPLRHAVEIRHDSFATREFIDMLRRHDVALVCADTVDWPRLVDVTADFVYCRLHGSEELYASGYDDASLDRWAEWVTVWAKGGTPQDRRVAPVAPRHPRDVFLFFDNDAKVRAPRDAQGLMRRLGLTAAGWAGDGDAGRTADVGRRRHP